MLNFFGTIGIYSAASNVAVGSSAYSAFTTTSPTVILTAIFGGGGLLALVAIGLGAVVGINPLQSGAIGFVTGTILTTLFATLRVFNNISVLLGPTIGGIFTMIVVLFDIIAFFSIIWYVKQMISGGDITYE